VCTGRSGQVDRLPLLLTSQRRAEAKVRTRRGVGDRRNLRRSLRRTAADRSHLRSRLRHRQSLRRPPRHGARARPAGARRQTRSRCAQSQHRRPPCAAQTRKPWNIVYDMITSPGQQCHMLAMSLSAFLEVNTQWQEETPWQGERRAADSVRKRCQYMKERPLLAHLCTGLELRTLCYVQV